VSRAQDCRFPDVFPGMETTPPRRSARIGLTGALSALVVISLVAAGGVGFARSPVSAAQYQYGKKVTICHKGKVTITISRSALPAHLAHGDKIGPCDQNAKKKKKKQKQQQQEEAKKKAEKAKEAEQKAEKAKEKAEKAKAKAEDKAQKADAKKEKAEEKAEKSEEKKGDDHGKSDEDHGKGQGPGKGKK
jgi:outer membrane biosynthesis protein TonB